VFLPNSPRAAGTSRASPFPLPHCSFTPAAIPQPLKPVISSRQRKWNDKSIQKKKKTQKQKKPEPNQTKQKQTNKKNQHPKKQRNPKPCV